jgi:hypothetical protein
MSAPPPVACAARVARHALSTTSAPTTAAAATSAKPSTTASTRTASGRGSAAGGVAASRRVATTASSTPPAPPAAVSTAASARNGRSSRAREAPTATRTPSSRRRASARARSSVPTFAVATRPSTSAPPKRRRSAGTRRPDELLVQRHGRGAHQVRVVGVRLPDATGDGRDLARRRLGRHAVAQARHRAPVVRAAARQRRAALARDPQLGVVGEGEARRQHADHGVPLAVEHERQPADVGRGAERAAPEPLAHHHGRRRARHLLVRDEPAPADRAHAHHREEVARHDARGHALRLGAAGHGEHVVLELRRGAQRARLALHVGEVGVGELHRVAVLVVSHSCTSCSGRA